MRKLLSRLFSMGMLFCLSALLPGQISMGDPEPPMTAKTALVDCDLSPDPELCRQQQSQPKPAQLDPVTLLNAKLLEIMGPYSAEVKFDDDLGWIIGLGYVQMFNEDFGMALRGSFGPNEIRANITSGFSLGSYNQIKVTYEYLSQNQTFGFESGGIRNWVSQHALGGTYQLLMKKWILHSLELSGSYARAQNSDANLASLVYYEGDDPYFNMRNIAPGREGTGLATVNLVPFKQTALALGAGFSSVHYDTVYQTDQNNDTVAYKAEVSHILRPTIKVTAGVNNTASSTEYKAKVSKILNGLEFAVGGLHQSSRGNLENATSMFVGVTYPAPKKYTFQEQSGLSELKSWIEKPVVYYNRVLAIKDEYIEKYYLNAAQPIPNQTKNETQNIDPVNTQDYFSFNTASYDKVTYTFVTNLGNNAKDYSDDLKLQMVPSDNYQAVLQSAQPIPTGFANTYTVTITATGIKQGLQKPVTQTSAFNLVVKPVGPSWTDKALPDAPMGMPYPTVNLDDGFVTNPDNPSSTFTFALVSGPAWVTVVGGHTLEATPGTVVPQDSQSSVSVVLKVTDQNNVTSQKTFQLGIDQQLPVWDKQQNYQNWVIKYDDTSGGILLSPYIADGNTGLSFSFANNQLTYGNWVVVNEGARSYLRRNTPSDPLPDDLGKQVNLVLVAHNTTSLASDQEQKSTQPVMISVSTDDTLPAPTWLTTQISGTAGSILQIPLPPLVKGSVTNDSYTFKLTNNDTTTWLSLSSDGQSLVSNGALPPISDQDSGTVQFSLNASSRASNGQTGDTVFSLIVTNLPPVWQSNIQPEAVTIPYDATVNSSQPGIYLNPLVASNINGLKFYFDGDKTEEGNWAIVKQGNDYYLKRLQADSSDIGSAPPVKIWAFNNTYNGGVQNAVPVVVVGDVNQPGATWNSSQPLNATAGMSAGSYDFALQQLFTCPQGDTCKIVVDLTNVSDWLKFENKGSNGDNTQVDIVNTAPVPAASTDPSGLSKPFHVTVTSLLSGKTIDQDFQIPINNVLPVWQNVSQSQIRFDDISTGLPTTTGGLAGFIQPGTDANLTFQLDPTASCAANFNAANWNLGTGDTVFHRSSTGQSDISDIYNGSDASLVQLPIKAMNTTSVSGTTQCVPVQVMADDQLPAPSWTGDIRDAQMGYPYPSIDLNDVDAQGNPIAVGSVANDELTFAFAGNHPQWLDIQPCTPKGKPSQCLVGVGNVPTSAGDNFSVDLVVTSRASSRSTPHTFTHPIIQQAPVWAAHPSGSIPYDDLKNGIDLNQFIQDGQGNPQGDSPSLYFELQNPNDTGWVIVQKPDGHYYLELTEDNPAYNDLDAIGKPANPLPVVIAHNNTSTDAQPQPINVDIIVDANKPGAAWNGNVPTSAQAGSGADAYVYWVHNLFNCPTDDRCQITADISNLTDWLAQQPTADQTDVQLHNTALVPTADTDPSGFSQPFHVAVYSVASGKQIAQDFQIPIDNVLPFWTDPENPPQLMFDGKSPDTTVHLNTYITKGNEGLSFLAGSGFDSKNWRIIQQGQDYYLQRTSDADVNEVGSIVEVPIVATNATSHTPQPHNVQVSIVADNNALPVWQGTIPDAYMGYAYGWDGSAVQSVDLNQFVSTPNVDHDSYSFAFDDSHIQHPAWLTIQGTQLLSSGNVPTTQGASFTVSIQVTNKASGQTVSQTFTEIPVHQLLPGWVANPSAELQFNSLDSSVELSQFIQSGQGNAEGDQPVLSFAMKDPNDPYWKITSSNGHYYLSMTAQNPSYNNLAAVDQPATPKPLVTAYNNTSSGGVDQSISIQITPDMSQLPPQWNSNAPANTYAQTQNYTIKLCEFLGTGDCSTDAYRFTVTDLHSADLPDANDWLKLSSDGQTLIATTVPTASEDTQPGSVKFTLSAQSDSSGQYVSQPKSFSFLVNNILPVWTDPDQLPSVKFDAKSDGKLIHLNSYISSGNQGLSFVPGQNFDSAHWQIEQDSTDSTQYYLQLKNALDLEDIGTTLTLPILAHNSTSQNGTEHLVKVNIIADQDLPAPAWNDTLVNAYMGYPFGWSATDAQVDPVNLTPMVSTAGYSGDQFTFAFDANASNPTWLALSGDHNQILGSSDAVPNVPLDQGSAFAVSLIATSKASGKQSAYTFNKSIIATSPEWLDDSQGSLQFNDANAGIALPQFIKANTQGNPQGSAPVLSFALADSAKADWVIVHRDGQDYLQLNTQGSLYQNAARVGDVVQVPVYANNNTSNQTVGPHTVSVQLLPDSSQQPPVWGSSNPADTNAGVTDYQINFSKFITDPSGGSSYIFTVQSMKGTDIADPQGWLSLSSDGQSLIAALVPTATVNPPEQATVQLVVVARSMVSGQTSQPQTLTFHVNNILPAWIDSPKGSLQFNDSDAGIPLSQFIQANTRGSAAGTQPALSFDLADSAKADWVIVHHDNDDYLQLNTSGSLYKNANQVDKTIAVPVIAMNNTSVGKTDVQNVMVTLLPDSSQKPPVWSSTNPSDTLAGTANYQIALNKLVSDPAGASSYIFTVTDTVGVDIDDPDTWLLPTSDGQGLQADWVPTASVDPPDEATVTLTVTARSTVSGQLSSPQLLTFHVGNLLPAWIGDPAGAVQFNDDTAGIALSQFIQKGTQGSAGGEQPSLSFTLDDSAKADWVIVHHDNEDYLQLNTAGQWYKNAAAVGNVIQVPVNAINNTSHTAVADKIAVTLSPDSSQKPPTWTASNPSDTNAGTVNYQVDLAKFVNDPAGASSFIFTIDGITGDQISDPNDWLTLSQDQQSLLAAFVPNATVNPPKNATISIKLKARSTVSGQTSDEQTLTFHVNNVLPAWQKDPSGDMDYLDTTSAILLNEFITKETSGTTQGEQPALSFALPDKAKQDWVITHDDAGNYYLKLNTNGTIYNDVNEIGQVIDVPVLAYNNTSLPSEDSQNVAVTITAHPPLWTGKEYLGGTQASNTFTTDLNQAGLLTGISGDTYQFTIVDNAQGGAQCSISKQSVLTCSNVQAIDFYNYGGQQIAGFAITLMAKSNTSLQETTAAQQVWVQVNPGWTANRNVPIRFDDTTGVQINNNKDYTQGVLINPNGLPMNCFIYGGRQNYIEENWDIVNRDGNCYLVRKLVNTSEIDAEEVGKIVDMNVAAAYGTAQSGYSGSTLSPQVDPDPAVYTRWSGLDSTYDLTGAYPTNVQNLLESIDLRTLVNSFVKIQEEEIEVINDSVKFTLSSVSPPWLSIEQNFVLDVKNSGLAYIGNNDWGLDFASTACGTSCHSKAVAGVVPIQMSYQITPRISDSYYQFIGNGVTYKPYYTSLVLSGLPQNKKYVMSYNVSPVTVCNNPGCTPAVVCSAKITTWSQYDSYRSSLPSGECPGYDPAQSGSYIQPQSNDVSVLWYYMNDTKKSNNYPVISTPYPLISVAP